MLDFAVHDPDLLNLVETTIREAGGEIERD
jgi:hypothetical protein